MLSLTAGHRRSSSGLLVGLAWACVAVGCGRPASVARAGQSAPPPSAHRPGRSFYVSPHGRAGAPGTRARPWDIQSALAGKHDVRPGDTIWLRGGTFRHPDRRNGARGWTVHLNGAPDAPITVRACPGERVTLDGALSLGCDAPASYVWLWGLELVASDMRDHTYEPAANRDALVGPGGGVELRDAPGCRMINLVIHHTYQAISCWVGALDCEMYGCVIYDNGWMASDRGDGHGIYTQNRVSRKVISDCIITTGQGFGQAPVHAYGSRRAWVNGYTVSRNILYAPAQRKERLLVGGERDGAHGNSVIGNLCYNVSIQLGYTGAGNRRGSVADNLVYRGRITAQNYLDVGMFRNTVVDGRIRADGCGAVRQEGNRVFDRSGLPSRPLVKIIPNRYELGRANIAIFNWRRHPYVAVNLGAVLKPGDRFCLMDPEAMYGRPICTGVYSGAPVQVPAPSEFVAYVLLSQRNSARSDDSR